MTRDEINELGNRLQALRLPDETSIIVNVGAHAPYDACRNGYTTATIRRGSDEVTSEAVNLQDALFLARGKLDAIAKKREAEKASAPVNSPEMGVPA